MRKTLCASVLVLALCGSALAGDIHTPPHSAPLDSSSQPSETQTSDVQTTASWGEAPAADGIIYGNSADDIVAATLAAFGSVLALL